MCYGVGLPDCWPHGLPPSKMCWPEIVAKELKRECVNMSVPGAGNKRIWYNISNFKFKPDDLVLILWSFPNRYTVINSKTDIKNLHHNNDDVLSNAYFQNLYEIYDSKIMSTLFVDHANRILKEKKVTFYQMAVKKRYWYMFGNNSHLPITMDAYETLYTRALDNDHAGINGHRAFAVDLLKLLGTDTTLDRPQPEKIINRIKFPLWKIFVR
jgi:hypothetical protein